MDFPAIEIYNPEALSSDFLSSFIQRHTQTHKVYKVKKKKKMEEKLLSFFGKSHVDKSSSCHWASV